MKITDLPKNEAISEIIKAIGEAHKWCNFTIQADIADTASRVYIAICNRYPSVTVEEINETFVNGVLGDYGDFAGLSAVSLVGFIKSARNKKTGVNCQNLEPEKPAAAPVEFSMANYIKEVYEKFCKNEYVVFDAEAFYNYIVNNKIALFSESVLKDYRAKAIEVIQNKKTFEMSKRPSERNEIKNYLEELRAGKREDDIIYNTQKVAVLDLFRQWQEDNEDINQILN